MTVALSWSMNIHTGTTCSPMKADTDCHVLYTGEAAAQTVKILHWEMCQDGQWWNVTMELFFFAFPSTPSLSLCPFVSFLFCL